MTDRIKPEIEPISFKAQDIRFVANELLAKADEMEYLVVTVKFKDGKIATMRSFQTDEQAALILIALERATQDFIYNRD